MPDLSPEQQQRLTQALNELFPATRNRIPLTAEESFKKWWSCVADSLPEKMLKIDRDQMRSAAESQNRWVR